METTFKDKERKPFWTRWAFWIVITIIILIITATFSGDPEAFWEGVGRGLVYVVAVWGGYFILKKLFKKK